MALLSPASALAQKFTSGVTAGEITNDAAIVWGRAANQGFVQAQVSRSNSFQNLYRKRILRAVTGNNNTVQTRFTGLQPSSTYYYRFCISGGSGCSSVGRFQTAPPPNVRTPIRFAYSGDETGFKQPGDADPFWGNFKALSSMVAENNHFNIDFGDTIYSDPEVPGAPTALGVGQKWAYYRQKLAVQNMQRIRKATGLYNHWDDHEFINDFSDPRERTDALQPGSAGVPQLHAGHVQRRARHLPKLPLGQEPGGFLPRPALVPKRQGIG